MLKYYLRAAVLPSFIAIGATAVYGALDIAFSNYKSEWLTTDSIMPAVMLMSAVNSLIFCLFSLPVFINRYELVQRQSTLSFLCWFLGPAIWMVILIVKMGPEFELSNGIDSAGISFLINIIPYPVLLAISYFQFRRKLPDAG